MIMDSRADGIVVVVEVIRGTLVVVAVVAVVAVAAATAMDGGTSPVVALAADGVDKVITAHVAIVVGMGLATDSMGMGMGKGKGMDKDKAEVKDFDLQSLVTDALMGTDPIMGMGMGMGTR